MLASLLPLTLAASLSLAVPPASEEASLQAPAEVAPGSASAPGELDGVLQAAWALQARGEPEAARDLLEWLLQQQQEPSARQRAVSMLAELPPSREEVLAAVRFAAWQGSLGAFLLGPNLAVAGALGPAEAPYFVSSLLGGGLGMGSALYLSSGLGVDEAGATIIAASQQLGGFNGAALGYTLAPDWPWVGLPAGITLGVAAGSVAGYLRASRGADRDLSLALQSGAFWGLGLGLSALTFTYGWERLQGGSLLPLVLACDIGAAGGWALARATGATREDLRLWNLGGALGAFSAYGFAWLTSRVIWYTPHGVAAFITVSGLAGAALAILLPRRLGRPRSVPVANALISGQRGELALSLPAPTALPSAGGVQLGMSLVDYRF